VHINPLFSSTDHLYDYKVQVKLFFYTPLRTWASGGIISSQLKLDIGWRLVLGLRHEYFALQECTSDNLSHRKLVGSQIRSGRFLERAVSCLCLMLYCSYSMQQTSEKQMFSNLLEIFIFIVHCSYMFRPYNLAIFREPMPLLGTELR
jgi:hypothetical protein